jgi:hypothetical protein
MFNSQCIESPLAHDSARRFETEFERREAAGKAQRMCSSGELDGDTPVFARHRMPGENVRAHSHP